MYECESRLHPLNVTISKSCYIKWVHIHDQKARHAYITAVSFLMISIMHHTLVCIGDGLNANLAHAPESDSVNVSFAKLWPTMQAASNDKMNNTMIAGQNFGFVLLPHRETQAKNNFNHKHRVYYICSWPQANSL